LVILLFVTDSIGNKIIKNKHQQSYRRGKRTKFFFSRELYRRTCFVCISNGKSPTDWPSVIVAWTVNISKLSVQYRQIYFVGNINNKHRRNISTVHQNQPFVSKIWLTIPFLFPLPFSNNFISPSYNQ
jgi:hypothetical protein